MKQILKIGVDVRDLKIAKTGARTYLEELCREFKKPDEAFEFIFLDTGIPVYTGKNSFLKLVEHFRFVIWKQCVLPLQAALKGCDIVFCTDYFVPWIHLGFLTIPVFHDAFFWEYPGHYNKYWLRLFHFFGMGAAKRSAYIITVTRYAQKRIALLSGLPEQKIIPVYEAAKSLTAFSTQNKSKFEELSDMPDQPFILHVGTFEKRKNLGILIEAFGTLLKNGHPNLTLVLIGQPSPKKDMDESDLLLQQIDQEHLQGKVIMPGYVSNELLHLYYQHAMLYVFPSRNEGFGLPVLEAFAHQVPVIIADNSCLPEIAGDAAIGFNPDDAGELCMKMKTLLENTDARNELVSKGNRRLAFFSWEKAAGEIKDIFRLAYLSKQK